MTVHEELELVRSKNGGILKPIDVVEFAKDPKTQLHSRFEWDDSKAALQHRLEQARLIIRFTVVKSPHNKPYKAYVSFTEERKTGESYRSLMDVMSEPQLRERLLIQALKELESWKQKYRELKELADVFEAISRANDKVAV